MDFETYKTTLHTVVSEFPVPKCGNPRMYTNDHPDGYGGLGKYTYELTLDQIVDALPELNAYAVVYPSDCEYLFHYSLRLPSGSYPDGDLKIQVYFYALQRGAKLPPFVDSGNFREFACNPQLIKRYFNLMPKTHRLAYFNDILKIIEKEHQFDRAVIVRFLETYSNNYGHWPELMDHPKVKIIERIFVRERAKDGVLISSIKTYDATDDLQTHLKLMHAIPYGWKCVPAFHYDRENKKLSCIMIEHGMLWTDVDWNDLDRTLV